MASLYKQVPCGYLIPSERLVMADKEKMLPASKVEAMEKRWKQTHANQIMALNRLQSQIETLKGAAVVASIMLDREGTWSDEDEVVTTLHVAELEAADIGKYSFEQDSTTRDVRVIRKGKSSNDAE